MSIVFSLNLEEAARMLAYGAYFRSFFPNHDMAAVTAYPDCIVIAGKYYAVLDVGQQTAIALFVVTFDGANSAEAGLSLIHISEPTRH